MALRYWVGSGSTSNWNATGPTNWSTQSGVPNNAGVPGVADDVIFDGAGLSGQSNSTISATITVKSLTIEHSYTGTMTHNAQITVSNGANLGNLTLGTGYTIAGTSPIRIGEDCTIISRGKVWPNNLVLGAGTNLTVTLSGSDFEVAGALSNSGSSPLTINATGHTLTVSGGASNNSVVSGTGYIRVRGGVLNSGGPTATYANILLDGDITIGANTTTLSNLSVTRLITYSSGTINVNTNNSSLRFAGTVTADTSGMVWNNVVLDSTSNSTLISDLHVGGLFTQGSAGTVGTLNTPNNSRVFLYSGASLFGPMNSGTADIYLKGGTWRGNDSTSAFQNNLFIDGDVTLSGANINYGGKRLKYLSGNVILTGATPTTPTLGVRSGCTLDISAITLNNFTNYNTTNIITLDSDLNISGLCSINTTATINTGATNAVIDIYSGMSINAGLAGTAKILFSGGIWSQAANTYSVANNLDIVGNVQVSGANTTYALGTLRYISGNVITTGSTLNIRGNSTLDTSGITWENFSVLSAGTISLNSNLNLSGSLITNALSTINTGTTNAVVNLYSGITLNSGLRGNAKILFSGGVWSQTLGTYGIGNNLDVVGNVQISGTTTTYSAGTLTYVSGNVITTGSTLNIFSACTLNTSGMTWNNIRLTGTTNNNTILNSNLNLSGSLITNVSSSINTGTTNSVINIYSGITLNAALAGNAKILFSGGVWSQAASSYGISNILDIVGDVQISGANPMLSATTLTYVSGSVISTGSTLNLYTTNTLETSGMTWNNINTWVSNVTTLNSDLNLSGALITSNTTTINTGTTNAVVNLYSGLTFAGASVDGTAKLILRGGIWTISSALTNLTASNNIDINGNVEISGDTIGYSTRTLRYVSGNVITTGLTLNIRNSCVLDTSGMTWNNITFANPNITRLNSDLNISGSCVISASTTANTGTTLAVINAFNGVNLNSLLSGSAKLVLKNGIWSQGATTYALANSLDIDGNVQISGTNLVYSSGTLTYVSGNVIVTGSTLNIFSGCTLDTSGMTWNNIRLTGAAANLTVLNSDLNVGRLLTSSVSSTINTGITNATINLYSGITLNAALAGNAKILFSGGVWSQSVNTFTLSNNLDIVGDVILTSTTPTYSGGTLRYVSGNLILTGSTLNIRGNTTFDTSGMSWNLINFIGINRITLNSDLNVNNLLTITSTTTINTGTTNTVINLYSGLTLNAGLIGNATVDLKNGIWSQGATTYALGNNLDIDGNVQLSGTNLVYSGGTLRYISGNLILTGSTLNIFSSCTLDTSGMTWNNIRLTGASSNLTALNSDLNVGGLLTVGTSATANTGTTLAVIKIYSGVTLNAGLTGNAKILFSGGIWSQSATTFSIGSNLDIVGDVQISGTTPTYSGGTLRYVSGNVIVTGSTLNIRANPILDTSGMTWNNVRIIASGNTSLNSDLNIGGLFITSGTSSTINTGTTNASIRVLSGMNINVALSGTSKVLFIGGIWSQGATTYAINNDLDIVGDVQISGSNPTYGTGTLKYVSGNVIVTGSTLNIRSSCILDASAVTWNIVNGVATATLTLVGNLTAILRNSGGAIFTINKTQDEIINCNGISSGTGTITGTAPIYIISGSYAGSTIISSNTYINGNVTIGSLTWGGDGNIILRYLSGTSSISTLGLVGASSSSEWAYVDLGENCIVNGAFSVSNGRFYLMSKLIVDAQWSLNPTSNRTFTFGGTAGFQVTYLWHVGDGRNQAFNTHTINLKADPDILYEIYYSDMYSTRPGAVLFQSDTPGVRARMEFGLLGSLVNINARFIDIDNSAGAGLFTFANPLVTNPNCINIYHIQDIPTISSQMFNL